ncbi:hypothetical protein FFLO_04573 [Filobasidium floriforme]|uniref:Small nuclear ribonucleoprotein G n=1 Tax=Filobasidium floriforme TaxID=5210 RepID=A0A8K0NM80_9TREE|nr:uncharacterized protein HD553DRAFT_344263 [Filobasidium floriforme]KAG7531079.1 hypothetical protein FFLO_04573 [Filobasidium floriforme]KAH8081549.1 hypothetical protein HD553DRAFT_344263 [Filobasidium floriforme]
MSRAQQPELKKYMDKPVRLHLNANRYISGTLRGYDMFLNLVLDDTMEDVGGGETVPIKTTVVRGNSVVSIELLHNQRVYR